MAKNKVLREKFGFQSDYKSGLFSVKGSTGKHHFYWKRSALAKTIKRLRKMARIK